MSIAKQTVVIGDLDVVNTYKELMEVVTGEDSIYIKAKETVLDLFEQGGMTNIEKSQVISKMMSDITVGMSRDALQAAIQISTENRDAPFALAKLSEDTKLTAAQSSKLGKEESLLTAQANEVKSRIRANTINGWATQANIYADTGYTLPTSLETYIIGKAAGTEDAGKAPTQDADNTKSIGIEATKSKIYETYAGSLMVNGAINIDGYNPTVKNTQLTGERVDENSLVYQQTKVAARNVVAFDDNMRQHAVNSSSAMVATLLSNDELNTIDDTKETLCRWNVALDYLIEDPEHSCTDE